MNNKPFLIIGHGSGNIINTDAIKNVLFIDIDDEEKAELIIDLGHDKSLTFEKKMAQAIYSKLRMMSNHV